MTMPQPLRRDSLLWAAFLLYILTAGSAAAALRGPWMDEFWSMWMALPAAPGAAPIPDRWASDVHPPLFYAIATLLRALFGDDLFLFRMSNLLYLAWPVGVGIWLARSRQWMRPFLFIFSVLLLSAPNYIPYFVEFRSYFAQMCFVAALVMALHALLGVDGDMNWRRDRSLVAVTAISALVAMNLHYVNAVVVGLLLGAAMLWALRARRYRLTAALAAIGVAGALPLLAAYWAQSAYRATITAFWIETTPVGSLVLAAKQLGKATALNLVALGFAAAGAVSLLRRRGEEAARPALRLVLLCAFTIAAVLLVVFLLSMVRPLVVQRHLLGFSVLASAAIAALAASGGLMARRWAVLLLLLNASLVPLPWVRQEAGSPGWNAGARIAAAQAAACPGTLVHAVYEWERRPEQPPNQAEVVRWAMPHMARETGFAVRYRDRLAEGPPPERSPGRCPTLLWAEHIGDELAPERVARLSGLRDPAEVAAIRIIPSGHAGMVVVLPSASAR